MKSNTVTNEREFNYTLDVNAENEIEGATEINHACSVCGEPVEEYCEAHPEATVDSVLSQVAVVDTPTGIGEDGNTDVVLFDADNDSLAGSFGLQVRHENGKLKAICDLDGETLSFSASWSIPNKVPAPIAEYAEAICS